MSKRRKERNIDEIEEYSQMREIEGLKAPESKKDADKLAFYAPEFLELFGTELSEFWDNLGLNMAKFALWLREENYTLVEEQGGFCPAELVPRVYGYEASALVEEIAFGKMR
jgi:hypothetical protein